MVGLVKSKEVSGEVLQGNKGMSSERESEGTDGGQGQSFALSAMRIKGRVWSVE